MQLSARAFSTARTALLIDGDNLAPSSFDTVVAACPAGLPDIRRVYGNTTGLARWTGLFDLRTIHGGDTRNGADIQLTIDTVEMVLAGRADGIVLATTDRDFTPLAHWLRERDVPLILIGRPETAPCLRLACHAFHELSRPEPSDPELPIPGDGPPAMPPLDPLQVKARALIRAAGPRGQLLQVLGCQLAREAAGVARLRNASDWASYFRGNPALYAVDPKGPQARVRWRGPISSI